MTVVGRINDDDIRALKGRIDIAAVIAPYTTLKGSGASLMGRCPFHEERSGSFSVNPQKNVYYCFGCGAKGDAIGFIQAIEGLSFAEAIERLARDLGQTLRYEQMKPGQRAALGKRTKMLEVIADAHAFYRAQLRSPAGGPAREYLLDRGVPEGAWEVFGIGWAPDDWGALTDHLQRAGVSAEELIDAQLASKGARGPIDRFRARVLFPIHDQRGGDVVAFGGRILPGAPIVTKIEGKAPKYINSPASPVYDKSATLYGLHLARREIVKQAEAVIVEGYMDVIALHLVGHTNVVAPCGTALTDEHLRTLQRMDARITLCLDGDEAGFEAAERARERAQEADVTDLGVLVLPDGVDPADLVNQGGAAAFDAVRKTRKSAVEFQIEHRLRDADMSTPELQTAAYRRTFDLLGQIQDPTLRYKYVFDVVAPRVGMSAQRIEDELNRTHPLGTGQSTGSDVVLHQPAAPQAMVRDPQMLVERQLLQLAVQHHDKLPEEWALLDVDMFTSPASRTLFSAIQKAGDDLERVLDLMPDDDMRGRVMALAASELTLDLTPEVIRHEISTLQAMHVGRRKIEVRERLARQREQLDATELQDLMIELQALERTQRTLGGQVGL